MDSDLGIDFKPEMLSLFRSCSYHPGFVVARLATGLHYRNLHKRAWAATVHRFDWLTKTITLSAGPSKCISRIASPGSKPATDFRDRLSVKCVLVFFKRRSF